MEKLRQNNKIIIGIIILFFSSAVMRGLLSDFPKVLSGYPDELRYVGIARSLYNGQGLSIHGYDSTFQKILYCICILPVFMFNSTIQQIRAIGYINSIVISSSIIPVYGMSRKFLGEDKSINFVLAFWVTLPTFVYTMYFMSEVVFLPLSLWVMYCVWCILSEASFLVKLRLNFLLGILCYLAYLNKEIALCYMIAYIIIYAMYSFTQHMEWKHALVCLIAFVATFVCFFLLFKGTLFFGLKNSYSDTNLQVLYTKLSLEKLIYLLFGFVYNVVFAILAFGIFPILVPIAFFNKKERESWFFLFLLVSFFIGCVIVSYMITLPEDFKSRSPRQHIRYLEPLSIPFYIVMIKVINKTLYTEETKRQGRRIQILTMAVVVFSVVFVLIGAGGGSFLADNSMLLYYELFARFACKSNIILTAVRVLISISVIIGNIVFCKNRKKFLLLFCGIFVCLNIVNNLAGCLAGNYRYGIKEELRAQASEANEYLHSLQGNILLISKYGSSPEDKRLFDTYIDRSFFVMDSDSVEIGEFLGDSVLNLESEDVVCDVSNKPYPELTEIAYLIVMDDYGIRFTETSVEKIEDFPLEGYSLYKNLDTGKVYFDTDDVAYGSELFLYKD